MAIGQLSHAWLAGQLARAWGNTAFGDVTPREEVILGAQQHDIGWARFDLVPQFNPETGLPRSFLEMTVDDHLAVWRDAPELLMSQSAHAALVVSMHGSSLSELRARSTPERVPALQSHIEEEHARQAMLCAELKVPASLKERIRRQMWTWDSISLALCNAWTPFMVTDVPTADGLTEIALVDREDGTWTLDPWPFGAARVEAHCEAKPLKQRYEDEASMREAFEQTVPVKLQFVLVAS